MAFLSYPSAELKNCLVPLQPFLKGASPPVQDFP